MNRSQARVYSILLIYIVLVVIYHLIGYTGHFGFDDIHYAELAKELLDGNMDFGDHYAYRFPVVLFTAFFYLIFGISDFASSLPALTITIFILTIVFNTLREHGSKALITGLSLVTFSQWFLFYSDKLMPDIFVALSILWALTIIHRYKFKSNKSKTARYAFLFTFALLFGFMSKGTIVLMLPLLLFLLVSDIIRKRDLKFWLYSLISGSALLAIYLITIWILTGNVMERFQVIADNSYLNLCSYDQQSLKVLLKRIFIGFFELSIYQSLATGFIFVFAILFQRKGPEIFSLNDSFSFFTVSAIVLFLSSSFMTISPSSYAPMCLDPRHYLFLIPVAAISASRIISDYIESKKTALQIIIGLLIVTVISFFLQGQTFWKLYLPLFILFVIYFFTGKTKQHQHLFIALFAVVLLLIPLDMLSYAKKVKYRIQKEIVVEQVLEKNSDCIIVTNEIQKRLLAYYSGFDEDQNKRFLSYEEFDADTAIEGKKLLLLNWHTRYLSGMELNDLPYYARNISPSNRCVFESKDLDLSIYELNQLLLPGQSGTSLLWSFNEFEYKVPFWSQDEQDISTSIKYAGAKSNRVSEYSSTFEYPLDSLQLENIHALLIQCSLLCYADDKTGSQIIVSLEDSTGTYFWKALEINRYLKAYSNWWPVSYELSILQKDLKSASRLKAYVWKKDNPLVYIDNFGIRITGIPAAE